MRVTATGPGRSFPPTVTQMKTLFALLSVLCLSLAHAGPTVELAAEASLPAANDLVRATLYSEVTGSNPGELSRKVNGEIAEALKAIKGQSEVVGKTGNIQTFPVYGKSRNIESWLMRSEILLESRNTAAISELIGKLQTRLALAGVLVVPSDPTRRQVEDEATRDAIAAFHSRAKVIADALGKPYRIKQLTVGQSSPVMPMLRAGKGLMMAAEAAPLPLEAGESLVTVNVSGQIELAD